MNRADLCYTAFAIVRTPPWLADSTDRAEVLAMEGDADGSMAMTEAADQFNEEHTKLHNELVMPERTKSVCDVCGVFINSTDNEQRRLVCSPTFMTGLESSSIAQSSEMNGTCDLSFIAEKRNCSESLVGKTD